MNHGSPNSLLHTRGLQEYKPMVIKINEITEALASFKGKSIDSVALVLVNEDWTPTALATPVAQLIKYWHASGFITNNPPLLSFLTARLIAMGWQYPQAFFAERLQTHCPATGQALSEIQYNRSFGFAMDEAYVVDHDGGCIPEGDAQWFGDDYRLRPLSSGWYHTDECSFVDGNIYPDWYVDRHAAECSVCNTSVWRHDIDSHGCCRACSVLVAHSQYLGGLEPAVFTLLPYDDRSSLRLPSQSRKTNRYGIELEILVRDIGEISKRQIRQSIVATHAYHAIKCFPDNYVVAKRDGSLYDCGFELVTKPDTYNKMHEALGKSLFNLNPQLTGTGTCEGEEIEAGLHINMERKGKSVFHQAKILYFMFDVDNRGFVTALAGRYCDSFAAFPERARWSHIFRPPSNRGSQKYVAVYVKEKVLEFRLFRSSISPAFVLSCLEFCEALTHFTTYASAQSLTYDEFISFVLATNKFPHLIDRLRNDAAFKPFLQNKTTK